MDMVQFLDQLYNFKTFYSTFSFQALATLGGRASWELRNYFASALKIRMFSLNTVMKDNKIVKNTVMRLTS